MAVNEQNLAIGPSYISWNGTDLGFTTDDGVTLSFDISTESFTGGQSLVKSAEQRTGVDLMVSAALCEVSQANLVAALDLDNDFAANAANLSWSPTPTQGTLVLTTAGPTGGTRVYTFTAQVATVGDVVAAKGVYQNLEIEWTIIGDPTNNRLGTVADSASSSTVPAVASYQKMVADTPTTIVDGATAVEVAAALQITFNVSIRPDMLTAEKFYIVADAANAPIAASVAYGDAQTKVLITPTASLATSTTYSLVAVKGIRSFDRLSTAATVLMQFTTAA